MATLNSNIPSGPLAQKWENHKFTSKLINPANKRKYKIVVVGAGLAGASASATLAELGYDVHNFVLHDSPVAPTRLPPKVASMPRRITRTTAIPCIASSTTP